MLFYQNKKSKKKAKLLQTLHSSWNTACWIILLLFKPPAMSSKSIADLNKEYRIETIYNYWLNNK